MKCMWTQQLDNLHVLILLYNNISTSISANEDRPRDAFAIKPIFEWRLKQFWKTGFWNTNIKTLRAVKKNIDWLIGWLAGWLTDWLTDWLIDW